MEELLSIEDLKKHLAIGNDKVYNIVRQRDFPAFKIGNRWKIMPDGLREWEKMQCRKDKFFV